MIGRYILWDGDGATCPIPLGKGDTERDKDEDKERETKTTTDSPFLGGFRGGRRPQTALHSQATTPGPSARPGDKEKDNATEFFENFHDDCWINAALKKADWPGKLTFALK